MCRMWSNQSGFCITIIWQFHQSKSQLCTNYVQQLLRLYEFYIINELNYRNNKFRWLLIDFTESYIFCQPCFSVVNLCKTCFNVCAFLVTEMLINVLEIFYDKKQCAACVCGGIVLFTRRKRKNVSVSFFFIV